MDKQNRAETLHALAMESLDRKSQRIKDIIMPVVHESVEGGETGIRAVPITDGKRIFRMTPIHHAFEMRGWKEVKIDAFFALIAAIGVAMGMLYICVA